MLKALQEGIIILVDINPNLFQLHLIDGIQIQRGFVFNRIPNVNLYSFKDGGQRHVNMRNFLLADNKCTIDRNSFGGVFDLGDIKPTLCR